MLTVNGAYQPVVRVAANTWQRWRVLYSGIKGFFVLSVYDADTNAPTQACEMQLYAKDGVYVQALPRRVGGLFLGAASRAEVRRRPRTLSLSSNSPLPPRGSALLALHLSILL